MSTTPKPAIIILSSSAFKTAQSIKALLGDAIIYSLQGRVKENDNEYNSFSAFVQELYKQNRPIIALCASGIIIRSLSPILGNKYCEPPVLSVAENGSVVVPLLGATNGANTLARALAAGLSSYAAITTSGELRFGINLLYPPRDLELINRDYAKEFITALLNGIAVQIDGEHPWLETAALNRADKADYIIRITDSNETDEITASPQTLVYRRKIYNKAGRVTVVGLGPGEECYRTQSANEALREADDILGYAFYTELAGPFAPHQSIHPSDNRQEIERARHAFSLAAEGRNAVLVSSGDPGMFAMAAAVFEAWEKAFGLWDDIDVVIEPGITAALAAAACFGAPLGHDCAFISLSDNLKPWTIIEKRLKLACQADLALALYNPVSTSRPHQLVKALEILRNEKRPQTIVGLAHDIARQDEALILTTLEQLKVSDVTSRTVILIGTDNSRCFIKNGKSWFYTPRSYRNKQCPA